MDLIDEMLKRTEVPVQVHPPAPAVRNEPPSEPGAAVTWMNAKHFVVSDGGKVLVATEQTDPELKRRVLKFSSFTDIRNFYCNRWVNTVDKDNKPKRVQLG